MLFEPPFGGLRDNVRTPSIARWKTVVDFLFIINELFRYMLRLRRYSGNLSKSACFEGSGSFERKFQMEGDVAHQHHCWCQNSKVVVFLCGIKLSAVLHLVLSQSTHVTNGQNYDSQLA